MTGKRSLQSLRDLMRATERLGDALAVPADAPLAIDGTIQRFEFVFELAWKTFRLLLAEEGHDAPFARPAIAGAYQTGWINDENLWLKLLQARNATSHTDDDALADRVYATIKSVYPSLRATVSDLSARFGP